MIHLRTGFPHGFLFSQFAFKTNAWLALICILIHYCKDWRAKKVLLKSKPYSDAVKYTNVLEAAEAESKLS